MAKLQTPEHKAVRTFLRIAGPLIGLVGLAFLIVGVANFFSSFGSFEPPRLFWCCFVGMPLLFVGFVLSSLGFMGAIARYTAAEQIPVATDAISDLADGTQNAVESVARSAARGFARGRGDDRDD